MTDVFCPLCGDRGCLMCDGFRARRLKLQAEEENLMAFLEHYKVEPRHPSDYELLKRAIRWGIEQERARNRPAEAAEEEPHRRFEMLEFDASQT